MEFEIGDLTNIVGSEMVFEVTGVIHDDEAIYLTPFEGGSESKYHFSAVLKRWALKEL